MKALLTLALMSLSVMSIAQQTSVSKSVTDDGTTLTIRFDMVKPDQSVHYRRSFDVSAMDRAERKALEARIVDSLETSVPAKQALASNTNAVDVAGGSRPYTKEVVDNPEQGTLFMRYKYLKNGEEFIVERTANVRGKSDREKKRIVESTEQDLGLLSVQ